MLMGVPIARESQAIKKVLENFMEASGMSINLLKSQIFFFNNPLAIQFPVSRIMGFSRSSLLSKYLGVPLLDSAISNAPWEDLLTKLRKKLSGWPLDLSHFEYCWSNMFYKPPHSTPSQHCLPLNVS
jgi:hypothetical protein